VLVVEREAHAEHPRLLLPVGDQRAAGGIAQRQPTHHGESIGVLLRRRQG
jgi:hypothetical protein